MGRRSHTRTNDNTRGLWVHTRNEIFNHSNKIYDKQGVSMTKCIQCGLENFDAPKREVTQHFCSEKCRANWFKQHTKEEWKDQLKFYTLKQQKIKLLFSQIGQIQRKIQRSQIQYDKKIRVLENMIESKLRQIQNYEKVI